MTTSGPRDGRTDPARTDRPGNPLLAVLGAGDAAVNAVARAFADAFSSAAENRRTVQQRVAELPAELEALRGRFSGDELRRALDTYRGQLERAYGAFAGRGEEAWGRLREQPQVRQAITVLEAYTERLDDRVDELVDTTTAAAQGAATRVLDVAGRQTRATGDRVTRTGRRLSGRAADVVIDATAVTADAVEDAGAATADAVEDAGTAAAGVLEDASVPARDDTVDDPTGAGPVDRDTPGSPRRGRPGAR